MRDLTLGHDAQLVRTAESAGFWTLFLTQTAALLVVAAYAIPLYRALFIGPAGEPPGSTPRVPIACAAALMQICYWSRRRFLTIPALRRDDLSGHLLLFLARSLFVGAATFLPVAFFVRYGDTTPSAFGVILVPIVLFAVFCYAWELERLARTRLQLFRD